MRSKHKPIQLTFHDHRKRTGRGGPRDGAGRKATQRPCDRHAARERFDRLTPVHVTLRIRRGARSLRSRSFIKEIRRSFRAACERGDFRLLQYSFQWDHVHLIVEAESQRALGAGMKSLGARITRAAHRAFGTQGRLLAGRYHAHALRTPREMHRALGCVLMNARKHDRQRFGRVPETVRLDEASSAVWFDGFSWRPSPSPRGAPAVAVARGWLGRVGWRRHGTIDPAWAPGSR